MASGELEYKLYYSMSTRILTDHILNTWLHPFNAFAFCASYNRAVPAGYGIITYASLQMLSVEFQQVSYAIA
jgi:hypothetical protein